MDVFPYTCEIVRRTAGTASGYIAGTLGVDGYGNPVAPSTLTLGTVTTVCDLQAAGATEPETAGEVSISTFNLYLPVDAALDTGDMVRVGGKEYELVGDPSVWAQGTAAVNHIEATVVRQGPG